jgi:aminobenzoyl-glutamate transport protein
VLQRYRPAAGLGTLISLMVPYSLALGAAWTTMLVLWFFTGLPLGPTAPLTFMPGQ